MNRITGQELFAIFEKALLNEKLKQWDAAVSLYDYCLAQLPESSVFYAIQGMKYRTLFKKSGDEIDYQHSSLYFSKAEATETVEWRKAKWRLALNELMERKKCGW